MTFPTLPPQTGNELRYGLLEIVCHAPKRQVALSRQRGEPLGCREGGLRPRLCPRREGGAQFCPTLLRKLLSLPAAAHNDLLVPSVLHWVKEGGRQEGLGPAVLGRTLTRDIEAWLAP